MPFPAWQDPSWRPPPAAPAATPAAGANPAQTPPNQPPPMPPGVIGPNMGPQSGNPLQGFANWMFSGGVNPNQWQNTGGVDAANWQGLGGGPNLGFLDQFNQMLQGGANPTQVAPTSAQSLQGAAQPYADAAYQQATRELDPQWDAAQRQFNQQMVNQGLAPGSEAYQTALDNFSRSRNDAYSQAQAQAQTQGLAAQGQGFGQGLAQSQLSSQLAQALLGSQTGIANQQLGGNASITNALLGGNQSLMQALLGGNSNIAQQIIGGNATRAASANAAGASMYGTDRNHDIQQQNIDNGMLMQLIGLGNGMTQYNNSLPGMQLQNNLPFFQYMPSGAGGGQIDVQSPYNNQYQGQMNQWGYQNQQADAQNQMYMNMLMAAGSMMMCSREWKHQLGELEPSKALEAVKLMPVDMWHYHGETVKHVGTYAEDFHKALGLEPQPVISVLDMLGALIGSVQSLAKSVERIEARLAVAGAEG